MLSEPGGNGLEEWPAVGQARRWIVSSWLSVRLSGIIRRVSGLSERGRRPPLLSRICAALVDPVSLCHIRSEGERSVALHETAAPRGAEFRAQSFGALAIGCTQPHPIPGRSRSERSSKHDWLVSREKCCVFRRAHRPTTRSRSVGPPRQIRASRAQTRSAEVVSASGCQGDWLRTCRAR